MAKKKKKRRVYSKRRFNITVAVLTLVSIVAFYAAATLIYYYFDFSRKIDQRLRGEREMRPAWVYARPLEVYRGQRITLREVVAHLNALRYEESDDPSVKKVGTFRVSARDLRIHLRRSGPKGYSSDERASMSFEGKWLADIHTLPGKRRLNRIELESVPVTPLFGTNRSKRRWVPLSEIPQHLIQAVVATEDRRFFEHTGLDPVGIVRAALEDLRTQQARQGGSTLTQQLVKNYFLTPERSLRRKLAEAFLAIILESHASKEEILELYLNDVYLGQRGSFGINGVGQASRVLFDKDVRNLELGEAALLAALIRAPNRASPFRHPGRAAERRNIVLRQMARMGFITNAKAQSAAAQPARIANTAVDASEAPYFIDALRRELISRYSADSLQYLNLSVFSTMDYSLQRAAQRAVAEGLREIQEKLAGAKKAISAQAALIALNPANGRVLALVGGRNYGLSQFDRAVDARRQPGSAFKPFVFLTAFEYTYKQVHSPAKGTKRFFTPASLVNDEPTTFHYGNRAWSPHNYSRRFEGRVTYRQALARSLNVATAKVGERVGFDRVVALWDLLGTTSRLAPYPSLVLGTFEVTPMELATAYAVIANGGYRVTPHFFATIEDRWGHTLAAPERHRRLVVHPETAFLVTDLMRSVIDGGTAREIRARGLKVPAAGKTGTTDDTRDAWFVGFVPDLLAVVWVGYDDNQKLGLTGSQAALPIWTRFMKSALAGRDRRDFEPPPGITTARIDPATGMLATAHCPRARREVFLTGTEPRRLCTAHR